jgi:hypothetical protein
LTGIAALEASPLPQGHFLPFQFNAVDMANDFDKKDHLMRRAARPVFASPGRRF